MHEQERSVGSTHPASTLFRFARLADSPGRQSTTYSLCEEPRHAAFTGAAGAPFSWHSAHAMQHADAQRVRMLLFSRTSHHHKNVGSCSTVIFYFLFSDVPSFSQRINNCWGYIMHTLHVVGTITE